MKITQLLVLILLLTACNRHDVRSSDARLRQNLTGTWEVKVLMLDGSSSTKDTKNTLIVAADDMFTYMVTRGSGNSNGTPDVTIQGTIQVKGRYIIERITNAVPHYLPESKRGTLPPGGVITRSKIIRLDERHLMLQPNSYGTVLYTKVAER